MEKQTIDETPRDPELQMALDAVVAQAQLRRKDRENMLVPAWLMWPFVLEDSNG